MNQSARYPLFRWLVIISLLVSNLSAGIVTAGFSPLMGGVAKDLGIHIGAASFGILGIMGFSAAVGMFFSGFIVDRIGVFKILIGCQMILILTLISIPLFATTFMNTIIIRIFQGLAVAGFTVATTPAMAKWFPREELGRGIGVMSLGLPMGIMSGLIFSPFFAKTTGSWKTGIAMLSIFVIVALIITAFVAAASKHHQPQALESANKKDETTLKEVLNMPIFWIGLVIAGFSCWVGNSFNDLSPAYLAINPPVGVGYGSQKGGVLMSLVQVSCIIGPVLAGFLVDKVFKGKNRSLMMVGWILAAVCYTSIIFKDIHNNQGILMLALLLAGFSSPFITVNLMIFSVKVFPPHILGRACGLWLSWGSLTGSVGVMIGSLALCATGFYTAPIVIIGLLSVVGLFLSLFLKEPGATKIKSNSVTLNFLNTLNPPQKDPML
jgi:MFS family permease